jgi:hypothetical protein
MAPTVSLLVPVYNREDLLRPCLVSALAQTFSDLEVVVVDGASTDGTWEVCREFATGDRRVRIVQESTNAGPVRGWARCLDEASGRFATFLWSDDVLDARFVERTIPYLEDDAVAFAYTAAEVGSDPGSGRIRYSLPPTRVMPSEEFILGSLRTRGRFPVSPACALVRLEDLRRNLVMELPEPRVDLSDTGAGADVLLLLQTAALRPKVAHIAEPLAFFRAHAGSISTDGRAGRVALQYALAKSWFARTHGRADLVPTVLAWHWLGELRARRKWLAPRAAVRQYHGLTTAGSLVRASFGVVASAARLSRGSSP